MRKTTIKALALLLAVSLLLLAGCNANSIAVSVRIIASQDVILYDGTVSLTAEQPTAMDATVAALSDGKLPAATESDGYVSAIAGIDSTDTDGWLLYYNGEMGMLGAKEQILGEGDTIEWKYLNYDEVFGE